MAKRAAESPLLPEVAFDSSALLAVILGEPGSEIVSPLLDRGVVSAINIAEIAIKMADRGAPPDDVRSLLDWIGAKCHPFDEAQAYAVGTLRRATRGRGLSLADNACLALARTLGLPVMTADRVWSQLDIGVEVRLIR